MLKKEKKNLRKYRFVTCSDRAGKVMVQNENHHDLTSCSSQVVNVITIADLLKGALTMKINPAVLGRFGMGVLMNVLSTNVWRMEALFL